MEMNRLVYWVSSIFNCSYDVYITPKRWLLCAN